MALEDFHIRFQELRGFKGKTQEEMSHDAGVSLRYYQDIEQGRKLPSLEKFGEMLERLETSPGNFFKEKPAPGAIPDFTSAVSFLVGFQGLSPGLQKIVLALVHKDPAYAANLPPEFEKIGKEILPLLKSP